MRAIRKKMLCGFVKSTLRVHLFVGLFCFGLLQSASAAVIFSDDFEGTLTNWTAVGSAPLTLSSEQNIVPAGVGQSALIDSSLDLMYHNLGLELSGEFTLSYYLYDDGTTINRGFGQIRAYTGAGCFDGTFQQVIAAGMYNAVTMQGEVWDATVYHGRVGYGTNSGWFNLNATGVPHRSVGWHRFDIVRQANGTDIDFYVDGILGRSIGGVTDASMDCLQIGSIGAGSSIYNVYVDGLILSKPSIVPAPDFDGDAKTDIALYRVNTGAWFYIPSSTNTPSGAGFGGDPSDIPVPGDYDGDGITDYGIYRLSTGAWFIYPSKTEAAYGVGFGGDPSDKPVPGDYDGDGITDLAIYRTATGAWFIFPWEAGASGIYGVGFGGDASDKPVPADYDGDGKTDIAIYRAATGAWFIYPSEAGAPGIYGVGFGGDASDKPVPADYDGDTKGDIAIYRANIGAWFIYPSSTGAPGIYGVGFGGDVTDKPVPGDYDGDRKADLAIYRANIGAWFIFPSSTGSSGIYGVGFGGDESDVPVITNPGSYM